MNIKWLLFGMMTLFVSGCFDGEGGDYSASSSSDNSSGSYGGRDNTGNSYVDNVMNETDVVEYKSTTDPTPKHERIVKVEYAQGKTRVYRLANGQRETRKGGSRAWRNNNEGNLEHGKFAKKYHSLGADPRFAIFPTVEAGRNAKKTLIFKGKNYRNLTLKAAISRYAPNFENNTAWYFKTVKASVGKNIVMKNYSEAERLRILAAMREVEGYEVGRVTRSSNQINNSSMRNQRIQ